MNWEYIYRTERVVDDEGNEYIAQLVADTSGDGDPRDGDNFTEIYGNHRSYTIGDGTPPSEHMALLERGGIRLLYRYMRRFGDPRDGSKVLAFTKLGMLDHSGLSFYTVPVGQDATHWVNPGGWDSGAVGYVLITQKRWDYIGGGDPYEAVDGEAKFPLGTIPIKQQRVWRNLEAEVSVYDDWARGNVWGIVISKDCGMGHSSDEAIAACPHSECVDSLFGMVGDPDDQWRYALSDLGYKEQGQLANVTHA